MFQYALYYALYARGVDAYIDTSWYVRHNCHNGYELNRVFNIQGNYANSLDVKRLAENDQNILWRVWHRLIRRKETFFCKYGKDAIHFFPEVFELDEKYLSGYWQSEKYFMLEEDDIRKVYCFSEFGDSFNIELSQKIREYNSVSIHVRRGDYLQEPLLNGICDEKYYDSAVNALQEQIPNPHFFIFSNDIDWCKNHFKMEKVTFVDRNAGQNSYRDMHLMSLCNHHIIANSSFSWWGAWLGSKNGITIAPRMWFNGVEDNEMDIYPSSWMCI